MTEDQTRASYDAVAAAYAEALSDELARKPLDRALLTAFAEQVREVGRGERRGWDVGAAPARRARGGGDAAPGGMVRHRGRCVVPLLRSRPAQRRTRTGRPRRRI